MLDMRVMIGRVGCSVMYIMIPFPSTDRKTTNEICNEYSAGVHVKPMHYAEVAGVMNDE